MQTTSEIDTEPAKRRPGSANFAIADPPLKLVLIEGTPGEPTRMDHLGVEVATLGEVTAAAAQLAAEGLATVTEEDAACYAVQDKAWVTGPGGEPWEVYVVKADSNVLGDDAVPVPAACCDPQQAGRKFRRTPQHPAADPGRTPRLPGRRAVSSRHRRRGRLTRVGRAAIRPGNVGLAGN